jgi:predicted deacylase
MTKAGTASGQEAAPQPWPRREERSGYAVRIAAPDIAPWLGGEVRGVVTRDSGHPGPHAALVAVVHGNEIAGAIVLDRLLRRGIAPRAGRISFIFANPDAFARFDAADPTASRFLEEDLNRIWDPAALAGPARSLEMRRAQALLPVLCSVDMLLDLHSMLLQPVPIMLAGQGEEALPLASKVGLPALIVTDQGHPTGPRLIDHPQFTAGRARALLLEAGLHWEPATVAAMEATVLRFLEAAGVLPAGQAPALAQRVARVTHTIVPASHRFAFLRPFRGGEVIAEAGTPIARDGGPGGAEIVTPYPDCLLVMPALRPIRGHTAVRLARIG